MSCGAELFEQNKINCKSLDSPYSVFNAKGLDSVENGVRTGLLHR